MITWKLEKQFLDTLKYRSYGLHYTDPRTTPPSKHRVDFCLSIEEDVDTNSYGIINKVIPCIRCACARDVGSRSNNKAAVYLYDEWLLQSGESLGDFPIIFHYVNFGTNVLEGEMITDVYLPLK